MWIQQRLVYLRRPPCVFGNGSTWYNFSASTAYYNVFTTSGEYVYLFLSQTFLKNLVNAGVSITNSQPFYLCVY